MLRSFTTTWDSWRPPARSHGLPGATCMSRKVMRMTKKTIGTIQKTRLTMNIVRLPALLPVSAETREWRRAPRLGLPSITAIQLLVLRDVRGVPEKASGECLVIASRDSKASNVGGDQVVFVILVDESDGRLVDQHLLRGQVVLVALGLVELAVGLGNQGVVAVQLRTAPVEAVARAGGIDVEPVLLVRVVGTPAIRALDVELGLANSLGDGLAVNHVQLHVEAEVGVPLVDDELVRRLAAAGVSGEQLEPVQLARRDARVRQKLLGRGRGEALRCV